MSVDVRVRIENVEPETWATLLTDNPYDLPLGSTGEENEYQEDEYHEWEDKEGGTSDWLDWTECPIEPVLLHLEALDSPRAVLHLEYTDWEGQVEHVSYQLDSPAMQRVDRFNDRLCKALLLEPPRILTGRCRPIEYRLPRTRTLDGFLQVDIDYSRDGGAFYYSVTATHYGKVNQALGTFTVHCIVRGIGRLERLLRTMRIMLRADYLQETIGSTKL